MMERVLQSIVIEITSEIDYPILGVVYYEEDGSVSQRFVKPPEHTYGAIQCDGKEVRTMQEFYDWIVASREQKRVKMNFTHPGDLVMVSAEFTRILKLDKPAPGEKAA